MSKNKKILKSVPAYTRWDSRLKKHIYVPPHNQHYYRKVRQYKDLSRKEKKELEDYSLSDLEQMSKEELYDLGEKHSLEGIRAIQEKEKIIEILRTKAIKHSKLKTLTMRELYEIANYHDYYGDIEKETRRTKEGLINAIANNLTKEGCNQWIGTKERVKELTNNEKYVIRLLQEDWGSFSKEKLNKLVGSDTIQSLEDRRLIMRNWGGNTYSKTRSAEMIYLLNQKDFEHLKSPLYPKMKIVLDPHLMKSAQSLGKAKKEYSIGIDFERELKQPQQIIGIRGGKRFTFHLGDDFEMFGHTHPDEKEPIPSKKDLMNLKVGRPEFLVAGKTGKTYIIEIGDENIYRGWKRVPVYHPFNYDLDTKAGRTKYHKEYGIKIYPYKKGMKIKVFDDPKMEKSFPFFSSEALQRISKNKL